MDVPQPTAASQIPPSKDAPVAGKEPVPDYGTLGPGSDLGSPGTSEPRTARNTRFAPLVAVAIGVLLAMMVAGLGSAHAAWSRFGKLFATRNEVAKTAHDRSADFSQIDRMQPQRQAEALLELAVAHSDGAVNQISSRIDRWQGQLKWDSQMATLTTAALNSNDMSVRQSAVEIELAAYGLSKNSKSLDYLMESAESADHAQKIWALWALGLMGNRGVETGRVVKTLSAHLKDADEDSRHWAVDGLALVGSGETIPLLLAAMHDDASPIVREEAACGLAQSGMFTREQRRSTVPLLLQYTDDPSLDARTHGWAFQALTDITGQHLPNDSAAWRSWFEKEFQQQP